MNKIFTLFLTTLMISGILSASESLETIQPNVLTVAVTGICKENAPHHNCWVYHILNTFSEENDLTLNFVIVDFDKSWELAANDLVDVTATGVTPLEERKMEDATFSDYYSIVKRGLRIRAADADKFRTIKDFVGYKVGAVKGMTSELDLRRRAIEGVEIVTAATYSEIYELFYSKEIDAVAEGYYIFPGDDINQLDPDYPMIDPHDLTSGELEGNAFVVSNASKGLVDALNTFIKEKGLPYKRP